MRLLTIDWDYFFRNALEAGDGGPDALLYDWGHSEGADFFLNEVWLLRGAGLLRARGRLPGTTGVERDWWRRFRLAPSARLYVSDSHVHAYHPQVRRDVDEVWLFDAHHDCFGGPRQVVERGSVDCANWALAYALTGAKVRVFYPRWKDRRVRSEAEEVQGKLLTGDVAIGLDSERPLRTLTFDRVHVCRSGAWTPPWLDAAFDAFVAACPVQQTTWLEPTAPRRVDREAMAGLAEQLSAVDLLEAGGRSGEVDDGPA